MAVWIIGAVTQYRSNLETYEDLINAGGIQHLHTLLYSKTELLIDCARTILLQIMEYSDDFNPLVITPDLIPKLMATYADDFNRFIRILNPLPQLRPYFTRSELKTIITIALKYLQDDGTYISATLYFLNGLVQTEKLRTLLDEVLLETNFIPTLFEIIMGGLWKSEPAYRGCLGILHSILVGKACAISIDLELMNGFAFLTEKLYTRRYFDSSYLLMACLTCLIIPSNRSLVIQSDLLPVFFSRKYNFHSECYSLIQIVTNLMEGPQEEADIKTYVDAGMLHFLCTMLDALKKSSADSITPVVTDALRIVREILTMNTKYVKTIKKMKLSKVTKEKVLSGLEEEQVTPISESLVEPPAAISSPPASSRKRRSEGEDSKAKKKRSR